MLLGYLFALLVVASGAIKGFCGKKISDYTATLPCASYSNFLRMTLCILIGFFFVTVESGLSGFGVSWNVAFISALSGISTAIFVISWLLAVRKGAYMMVDVFLLLGTSLPILLSCIFYGETLELTDFVGFALLVAAAFLLCIYNKKIKGKMKVKYLLLPILSGCANGILGFSQKMFIHNTEGSSVSVFNFYTYVFASAILGVFFLLTRNSAKDDERAKIKFPPKVYAAIAIMALTLFTSSFFNTLATGRLSAAELYPLTQGMAIIVSTFMAAVFFKEKVKPVLLIGLIFAFLGIVIMNLL